MSSLDDRSEFDEWLSTIELPAGAFELPEAEADSLGSLVDFAIDTGNGVVESPDEAAFFVVHDGYLYSYRPPVLGTEDAVGRVDREALGESGRVGRDQGTGGFEGEPFDGDGAGGDGPSASESGEARSESGEDGVPSGIAGEGAED